jgi:hypothetical protein
MCIKYRLLLINIFKILIREILYGLGLNLNMKVKLYPNTNRPFPSPKVHVAK